MKNQSIAKGIGASYHVARKARPWQDIGMGCPKINCRYELLIPIN